MGKNKRVLILNNYSVTTVTKEISDGLKPSHHLYGILELKDQGFDLVIIDPPNKTFWLKLSRLIDSVPFSKMGDILLQIQAFKRRKEYDIVYAPCQNVTHFLGLLAYFGIFKKKIIAIEHHAVLIGKLSFLRRFGFCFTFKGHYKLGALSSKVAAEINNIVKADLAQCFHWGPDLNFYDKVLSDLEQASEKPVDVISIGRTGRDYQVLIDAFNNTEIKVEIYCAKEIAEKLTKNHTSNISVYELDSVQQLTYPELIALYKKAKIMAIPTFLSPGVLIGLTSLVDALALGMPVLITENSFIEIDVENEEIGYWVKGGDSADWRAKALNILNGIDFEKFSYNSRKLAENKYNSKIFSDELVKVIENA